jgi:hypothetical protein
MAMAAWGVGVLTKDCGAEGTRYCYARVNSITMTESPNQPIESQKLTVTVDFQVADPYWIERYTAISLPNVTKTLVTNSSPNVVTLDGLFDSFPEFTFISTANITDIAIGWSASASSMTFANCQFKLEGMTAASIRTAIINCSTMAINLDNSIPYNVFIFVLTAGTVSTSRYSYNARF